MEPLTFSTLSKLLQPIGPSVSLYMPISWEAGQWPQNSLRLRKLLDEAERQLIAGGQTPAAARRQLASARELAADAALGRPAHEGLALLIGPQRMWQFALAPRIAERLAVGPRFVITPLIPFVQAAQEFLLLAVSQNRAQLFEATHESLVEVPIAGMPPGPRAEARGEAPEHQQRHGSVRQGRSRAASVVQGAASARDAAKGEIGGYLRGVNAALHGFLNNRQTPLLFAGVDYLFPLYQEVNTYPHLLTEHVAGNPETWTHRELLARALAVLAPRKERELADALADCTGAAPGSGSTQLAEIVAAAEAGIIESLVFAAGAQRFGAFDRIEGAVRLADEPEPGMEDMINRVVVETLRHHGRVWAADPAQLPNGQPLAARFRYPVSQGVLSCECEPAVF